MKVQVEGLGLTAADPFCSKLIFQNSEAADVWLILRMTSNKILLNHCCKLVSGSIFYVICKFLRQAN